MTRNPMKPLTVRQLEPLTETEPGFASLLDLASDIVRNSTAPEAAAFDTVAWLQQWIERPQPALGGEKPADLIGNPAGLAAVQRVLGAIESGAFL